MSTAALLEPEKAKRVMEVKAANYISVITLFDPIVYLIEKLDSLTIKEPNEVQAGQLANEYSIAVIVLSVTLLESLLRRTQYIMDIQPARPVRKFLDNFADAELSEELEEIFAIRDAIVHHTWVAEKQDGSKDLKLLSAELVDESGSSKLRRSFRRVLDEEERKTHKLRLNLFPTRIWQKDAAIVLQNVAKILLFLERKYQETKAQEGKDEHDNYISEKTVRFRGDDIRFTDLVKKLAVTWVHEEKIGRVPSSRETMYSQVEV